MVQDEMALEEESGGMPTGVIIATAVAAGIAAFLIRKARQREQRRLETPAAVAAAAWERASDADFRGRTVAVTRDFFVDRVLPEMKPVLLDLIRDIKSYIDDAFKRAEDAVRNL